MNKLMGSLLLALAVFGCKRSEEVPPQTMEPASAPQPAELSTTVAAAAPELPVNLETLAVEEDFEQEAEKEITMQNMTAKLDQLERQIGTQ